MMYGTVTFEPVLDLYFRLFMKQKQFYSVKSTEGSRPVMGYCHYSQLNFGINWDI